jgi:hypothetical protein
VHLSSSAPAGTVGFQLDNENFRHAAAEDDDPEDWNQLFNEVGHVNEVQLAPRGQCTVVVTFRPNQDGGGASDAPGSSLSAQHETKSGSAAFRERHKVQEARATIELTAVVANAMPTGGEEPRGAVDGGRASPGGTVVGVAAAAKPSPSPGAPASPSTAGAGAGAATAAGVAAAAAAAPPLVPPLVVVLSARHCVSLLRLDVHELAFDNVTIGSSSAVRDFTVWNCSEVPLRFRLALTQRGASAAQPRERPEIMFQDADSGLALPDAGHLILGFSHARVRAFLTPHALGQFSMQLQASNLNDARNRETLRIHAVVTSTFQAEGLRLYCGDGGDGTIDFGPVYAPRRRRVRRAAAASAARTPPFLLD